MLVPLFCIAVVLLVGIFAMTYNTRNKVKELEVFKKDHYRLNNDFTILKAQYEGFRASKLLPVGSRVWVANTLTGQWVRGVVIGHEQNQLHRIMIGDRVGFYRRVEIKKRSKRKNKQKTWTSTINK